MSQGWINSRHNQVKRVLWELYERSIVARTCEKWFEVAEMEMVLPRILCDILENSEYAYITANALVVWSSTVESLISGYDVARTKGYPQVILSTLNKLKHKAFNAGPSNTIIFQLKK